MDFFGLQDSRKRQSLLLLVAFVIAMVAIAFFVHAVIAGLLMLLTKHDAFWSLSAPGTASVALVWIAIFAGMFFRYLDIKHGGAVLARRFGAVCASDRSRFEHEKQLLNIVAEVSIASGNLPPDVFVLRKESGINAFVLGREEGQYAIVVTQGALDVFDREELQAVVAHEFGHINNNDLPLNMRLLMVLGGLMAIDEIGRMLLKGSEDGFHPGMIVGAVLVGIGSVSVFFGKIIRAAFSRQREFLADATAVQFTRNPAALALALDAVREHGNDPLLHAVHAQELVHLCFQSGTRRAWYKKMIATHPDLQRRIDAIDPHFAIKKRKTRNRRPSKNANANAASIRSSDAGMGVSAAANFVGTEPKTKKAANQAINIDAKKSVVKLSDYAMIILTDANSSMAALFALFATGDASRKREYFNSLTFSFDEAFSDEVKRIQAAIPEELETDQLYIVNHVSAILLRDVDADALQRIVYKLEKVLTVTKGYNLMTYATILLIRRKLNIYFPIIENTAKQGAPKAKARRVKTFDDMGREFALLLSLMVETSGAPEHKLDEQFQRALKCYTRNSYPRLTANQDGIIPELESAFQTLYVQPKSIRQAFVRHCIEIAQHDRVVLPKESAMLGLFAASLGCEELVPTAAEHFRKSA